jgi:hypothetical protein
MTPRDDIHAPRNFEPVDYEYLFSFSYKTEANFGGFNGALLRATITGKTEYEVITEWGRFGLVATGKRAVTSPWGKLSYFDKPSGTGGCDVCGAYFVDGDVWRHKTTGEAIKIGHICADKFGTFANRGEWSAYRRKVEAWKRSAKAMARRAKVRKEYRMRAWAGMRETLAANPGLNAALHTDHDISADLRAKLIKWGSLSDKQVALARKLAREANTPTPPGETEVLPPAGRMVVTGRVVSAKWVDNDFGDALKMLVKVTAPDGVYRLWGTVPRAIVNTVEANGVGPDGTAAALKGLAVTFTAKVEPKEPGFGFYSRPTKATVELPKVETDKEITDAKSDG